MSLTASEVHKLKKAPPLEGVLPIFHQRWSARSFTEREVSPEALRKVFEAARWAASGGNGQPWRFVVGLKGSETHEKIAGTLAGFNKVWAPKAPVLILGTALAVNAKGAANPYALYDLGAASAYLTLQAAELGMTTHQMAGFDHDAARQVLGIPEDYALGTVIALGYQGEPEALGDATLIEREITARTRKPLDEIVYSEWDKAAEL
jgi:nitroreductase